MIDRERALHLLMGRYRYEEAMRLFGEYCLLLEEDWNDFVARHSPLKLRQIHKQLHAVGLWPPELSPPARGTGLLSAMTGLLNGLKPPAAEEAPAPAAPAPGPDLSAQAAAGKDPEQLMISLVPPALSIELPAELLQHPAVAGEGSPLHDAIALVRYRLAHELGFVFPLVHLRDNLEMPANTYALRINGETVGECRLHPELVAAVGVERPTQWATEPHPVRPVQIAWLSAAELGQAPAAGGRAFASVGPRPLWTGETQAPHELLAEHLEDIVRRHAHRLFTNQALDLLLRTYEPEIGKDTYAELFGRFMSLTELRLVLQNLLKAGHSLRPLPRIVDILMTHYINYLAEKPLSMDETWKISSHIPFFSTEDLTGIVCRGLGLPPIGERLDAFAASLERVIRQTPDAPDRLAPLDGHRGWEPGEGREWSSRDPGKGAM